MTPNHNQLAEKSVGTMGDSKDSTVESTYTQVIEVLSKHEWVGLKPEEIAEEIPNPDPIVIGNILERYQRLGVIERTNGYYSLTDDYNQGRAISQMLSSRTLFYEESFEYDDDKIAELPDIDQDSGSAEN